MIRAKHGPAPHALATQPLACKHTVATLAPTLCAPRGLRFGAQQGRTSLMRSFPTMVQLLHRASSSSTGTLRSLLITPFRHPVSRSRMVMARVSTLAMPAPRRCVCHPEPGAH